MPAIAANLSIADLVAQLIAGDRSPAELIDAVYDAIAARGDDGVWLALMPRHTAIRIAHDAVARARGGQSLPLAGVPFAVKDNIDVAGLPTTAACPAYAYMPAQHANCVKRLVDAGAVPIGKTNMDQFATGLVGTRTPHTIPRNPFNPAYISGGSSSGSALAVALGQVPFALGTDTAGSGRVPAAFNHLVGLKPTRGLVSTAGVVPACRTLDCVSIFARHAQDAGLVLHIVAGPDDADPFSRHGQMRPAPGLTFRFGVPAAEQLQFFGDADMPRLYADACVRLEAIGGERVTIDYAPLGDAANLLYAGPWVAERYAAVGSFLESQPTAVHPVIRQIIASARGLSAVDAFRAMYRLAELKQKADAIWQTCDVLLLPTTPTIYRVDEVLAEPIALNSNLGYYTNFVNLLDMSAVALPAGLRNDGLPLGVTLLCPAFGDRALCALAERYLQSDPALTSPRPADSPDHEPAVLLAVVGAHLSGQPLNHQLTSRGAALHAATHTASRYRLYALANTTPPKPGLVRVAEGGSKIELEVWRLSVAAFGSFVAEVPAPLAIGSVELADGRWVKGFVCEPAAIAGARDITEFGGWRAFRAST